jgi:hypothetical protein
MSAIYYAIYTEHHKSAECTKNIFFENCAAGEAPTVKKVKKLYMKAVKRGTKVL